MRKQAITTQSGKCSSTDWALDSDNPGFKSHLHHLLTECFWINYLSSINLGFAVCKLGIIIVPVDYIKLYGLH